MDIQLELFRPGRPDVVLRNVNKRKAMVGNHFNRLTVLSRLDSRKVGKSGDQLYWLCICDCGVSTEVSGKNLRSGQVKSCGCLRSEVSRNAKSRLDHGHASTGKASPTYRSWRGMIERCQSHLNYIKKGISVCERWRVFRNFLADMGDRPSGHTLDRFPNRHGNYEPTNCRWATPKQQANNRG
jgi:hypothetical protein